MSRSAGSLSSHSNPPCRYCPPSSSQFTRPSPSLVRAPRFSLEGSPGFLSVLPASAPSGIRNNPQPLDPKSLQSHRAKNKASFRGLPGPPLRLQGRCRLLLVSASLSLSPGTCAPPRFCPVLKHSPCLLSEAPFYRRPSAPSVWQTLLPPPPHPGPCFELLGSGTLLWEMLPAQASGSAQTCPPNTAAGLRGPMEPWTYSR